MHFGLSLVPTHHPTFPLSVIDHREENCGSFCLITLYNHTSKLIRKQPPLFPFRGIGMLRCSSVKWIKLWLKVTEAGNKLEKNKSNKSVQGLFQ